MGRRPHQSSIVRVVLSAVPMLALGASIVPGEPSSAGALSTPLPG